MKKVLTWNQRFAEINAMRQRFAKVMAELIEENNNLSLVLADITADKFSDVQKKYPDRVINVGIREQLMIGVSGGLALSGMRTFVHTFSSFLVERPFEQIKISLSHQGVNAVLVSAGASYDLSVDGRTHQSPADVQLLSTLGNWNIIVPGNAEEAEFALRKAALGTESYYIRLSTETNHATYWNGEPYFSVLKKGTSGTVIAVGPVAERVINATKALDLTVLYSPVIRPFDGKTLRETLTRPDIAIVEPYLQGTSAHFVSESLKETPHRLLSIGVKHEELRKFGKPDEHMYAHGLDEASLAKAFDSFFFLTASC